MWQGPMQFGGESMMDPMGLYRQWFEGMENIREQTMQAMQGSMSGMNSMPGMGEIPSMPGIDTEQAAETWRKAVDATVEGWQKSADMTNEMMELAPKWQEMVEQSRDNLLAIEKFPTDPLEFAVQWYNATSGPYSDFVQELIEREEFLAPASQFLQNYASFYKLFRKNSEDYLKNLQIPTRSDITRVASLIVALEEKVDNIEDAIDELPGASPASSGSSASSVSDDRIAAVEKRLDGVEKKLDRLIDALETAATSNASAASTSSSSSSSNGNGSAPDDSAAEEIKATAAARRKAQDLGVDLTSVDGTGADGQITVDDVRKKGDA